MTNELRALALRATPGPWSAVLTDTAGVAGADGDHVAACFGNLAIGGDAADNAAYIAAANPTVILALLDVVEGRGMKPVMSELRRLADAVDAWSGDHQGTEAAKAYAEAVGPARVLALLDALDLAECNRDEAQRQAVQWAEDAALLQGRLDVAESLLLRTEGERDHNWQRVEEASDALIVMTGIAANERSRAEDAARLQGALDAARAAHGE